MCMCVCVCAGGGLSVYVDVCSGGAVYVGESVYPRARVSARVCVCVYVHMVFPPFAHKVLKHYALLLYCPKVFGQAALA